MSPSDAEGPLGEGARLAEIARIFARHGLSGLASRIGLVPGSSSQATERDAPMRLVALLRDLGPVAVKFGQMLATRGDLLGAEWVAALSTLQDQVPALPFEAIESELVSALGAPLDEVFARLDRVPIAAASIAQVYAATLRDGSEVVVKVRRPGIASRVDADLRLLRRIARQAEKRSPELRRLKIDELLRFFAESLSQEMDLSAEAAACEGLGAFLETLGVRTPKFCWDYVGRNFNVQERLPGASVRSTAARGMERTEAVAVAAAYADAVLRMIIFNGRFHADPHPGNVFVLPSHEIAFIDFGATGNVPPARRSELVALVLAIASDDSRAAANVLVGWSGQRDADVNGLQRDLADLIAQFRGAALAQIDLSDIFARAFALLRQHRLALPPDLALLLRTLLTAEGFVRTLDPEFDIAAQAMPIAKELARERISLAQFRRGGRRLAASLGRLAAASPELVGLAERIAKSGAIPVSISHSAKPPASATLPGNDVLTAGLLIAGADLLDRHPYFAFPTLACALVSFISGRRGAIATLLRHNSRRRRG